MFCIYFAKHCQRRSFLLQRLAAARGCPCSCCATQPSPCLTPACAALINLLPLHLMPWPQLAAERLAKMGPMSRDEKIMLATMGAAVCLWVAGDALGISAGAPPGGWEGLHGLLAWLAVLQAACAAGPLSPCPAVTHLHVTAPLPPPHPPPPNPPCAVTTAMLGLCVLLTTGVLGWRECLTYPAAWDTLFWWAGQRDSWWWEGAGLAWPLAPL